MYATLIFARGSFPLNSSLGCLIVLQNDACCMIYAGGPTLGGSGGGTFGLMMVLCLLEGKRLR